MYHPLWTHICPGFAVDALKPAKKQVISQFNRIDTRGRGFINSEGYPDKCASP